MDATLRIFGILFAIQIGVIIIGLTIVFIYALYVKTKHNYSLSHLQEMISKGDINIKYRDKSDKKNKSIKVDNLQEIVEKLKKNEEIKDESTEIENPYER